MGEWIDGILYENGEAVRVRHRDKLITAYIREGTRSIQDGAFAGCENLTAVYLPDGLTEIGSEAFVGCYKLSSANVPDTVTLLGNRLLF